MKLPTTTCAALIFGAASAFSQVSPDDVPLNGDIVVMGELHDIAEHHENQADWVARMGAKAVVFEMLEPVHADLANDMRGVDAAALGDALEWEARGWPDFDTYHGIFAAAGDASIFGAAIARDMASMAVADGAASVLGDDARTFLVDLPLPTEEQALRESQQAAAHCDLMPPEMLPGMVEVQRLRDARLAQTALQALDESGGPVAVITGNGHARIDWGVPSYLVAARPDIVVIAIGQMANDDTDMPFDARVVTRVDLSDRSDPCDALR